MSRSQPNVNALNPAVRWFEWNGEHGVVRYYDKDNKKNVAVPPPFTFLLLDELASVRGWHDATESGIYSNEVRDTRKELLVVKSFKGGTLAEGLYKEIKDRVNTLGGQFVANCYIAVDDDSEPGDPQAFIASLRFKGSALGAWMEFRKAHRSQLFDLAVSITGFTEGKKGRITFRVPTFELQEVSQDTNHQALALDRELQTWLEGYFSRRTSDQTEPTRDVTNGDDDQRDSTSEPLTHEDVGF